LRHKAGGAYRDVSTAEFARRVECLGHALMELGVEPGDRVALLSESRPEWVIADFAVQNIGAADVPVYPTLLESQVRHILQDSGAKVALVSTPVQLGKALSAAGDDVPLVVFDSGFPAGARSGPRPGAVLSLEEAYARGEEARVKDPALWGKRRAGVGPGTLASVIYTSGTTGVPKGVMLTHSNFASNVAATATLVSVGPGDAGLSLLPLAHVYERMVEYFCLSSGCSIAYAESQEEVARNLLDVRPTILVVVPRFLEKAHARVMEVVGASTLKRNVFKWAIGKGRERLAHTLAGRRVPPLLRLQNVLADRLVFAKVRERFGGRLRLVFSGAAPLSRHLAEFYLSAGITVLEGYGLTETSPVVSVNTPAKLRPGTVGPVLPGVEVRIAEDGEILVRGPNVMKGYWNMPRETAEALRDGWLHTGDVGRLDAEGFLVITDRKKDLIVTSSGKNVAPQPVENAMKGSPFVANVVCIGDGRNYVSALLVANMDAVRQWAGRNGLPAEEPPGQLLARPEVRGKFQEEVDRVMAGFAPYERIKRFALLEGDFTLEAGEVTPTLKLRRDVIWRKYAELIESLYA
jgi:long-chain acyl-CoA synthetase